MKPPLQPLLHDETVILRAPTQIWSAADGSLGTAAIHGLYFSDFRLISELSLTVNGSAPELIATLSNTADVARFVSVLRDVDDVSPDPGVRLERERTATVWGMSERVTIDSRLDRPLRLEVGIRSVADLTELDVIKAGGPSTGVAVSLSPAGTAIWGAGGLEAELDAPGARLTFSGNVVEITWSVEVPARGSAVLDWAMRATDTAAVVRGDESPVPWAAPPLSDDDRLNRWVAQALTDLDSLRMATTAHPEQGFIAAGAPWFFTLFGRDSLWTARFMLPLGTTLAANTLRVLAGLQGTATVNETAEQPGKILHELRRGVIHLDKDTYLPPLYFGTVDATALWIVLLHDAWRWGLPEDEVHELLPHLEAALGWLRDFADPDGDGLLEYADLSGHGLANQGWKDSGDSVQFADGRLAEGPIALCEVQAYAYEAALDGAALLESFGRDGSEWRAWAARLKRTFAEKFWVEDAASAFPAIALDARKLPVDSLTSNIGHLLGTGILTDEQSRLVAARLVSPELNSGFGLRTMSTADAGYWPLSYHGGTVWPHDTAIAISGLARAGFAAEAESLTQGLLAAATAFDYRMPELYSGDAADVTPQPIPYPASCRPQAWAAAASVAVLASRLGLAPPR